MGSTRDIGRRTVRREERAAVVSTSAARGVTSASTLTLSALAIAALGALASTMIPATSRASPESTSRTTSPAGTPATESASVSLHAPATASPPASAAAAPTRRAAPEPPRRTGRICVMALGTNPHYRLREGSGEPDMLIVSPETRPAEVLRKARADHPRAKVFAILNTMDIVLGRAEEGQRFWNEREDWFLHDATGERVRVRIRTHQGATARYALNIAHPGYQEHVGGKVVRFLEAGYDGIQLDNVETKCSYTLLQVGRFISALPVEIDEERWYAAAVAMLAKVRRMATDAGFAGRDIIFNHMRAGEPERSMEYLAAVEGANAEDWMNRKVDASGKWGWKARVELAREAGLAGKRTNLLANASIQCREEALFAFASYLMAFENDRNTFWYGRSYRPDEMPWFEFYDADLGRPVGAYHAIAGTGLYRRDFERGAVLVNPERDAQEVDLGAAFWDEAYEEVRSVSVPGKFGAILLQPRGDPPARRSYEAEACLAPEPDRRDGAPAPSGVKRREAGGMSGGAGVEFADTTGVCRIPVEAGAGRYRVVADGAGKGPKADAVHVRLGEESRRVGFELSARQVFDVHLPKGARTVDLRAAEPGVAVDRVILIRLGES